MLADFWRLNGDFTRVESQQALLQLFSVSDSLKDLEYRPGELAPVHPSNRLKGKTFTNVGFSKTEFVGVHFTNCRFVDCLFIGAVFNECEFHYCSFEGCNLYKAQFKNTYVDPSVFARMMDPVQHSNIGVTLFQRLMHDAADMRQYPFAKSAEYYFMRWKRYQLNYDFRQKKLTRWQYLRKWVPDLFYEYSTGYGLRGGRFSLWTIAVFTAIVLLNYFLWGTFGMHNAEGPVMPTWILAFYYTVATITTLGLGDIIPSSNTGMMAVAFEALLGILWLTVLATVIIRKMVR